MPRYRVDPRTVKIVQMKDGTRYRPDHSGWVSVGHQHEDEMRRSPVLSGNVEGEASGVAIMMPGGEGPSCPNCGFAGWRWQTSCPRCVTELRWDS